MSTPTTDLEDWLARWNPPPGEPSGESTPHLDPATIAQLAAGELDDPRVASVLIHLDCCDHCQSLLDQKMGVTSAPVDPEIPSLRFFEVDDVALETPIVATVEFNPTRGETYRLEPSESRRRIVIEVRSPRRAIAEFIGLGAAGWKIVARPLRLRRREELDPYLGKRRVRGLVAGSTLVVTLIRRPASEVIQAAINGAPAGPGAVDRLIARLIPALRAAGHTWFEAPVIHFGPSPTV